MMPKNNQQAHFIVNCILLNERMVKVDSFRLLKFEAAAVVMQMMAHGEHALPVGMQECRSLLQELHHQRQGTWDQIFVTPVDLRTCFWSLKVPECRSGLLQDKCGGAGQVYIFLSVPFGWKMSQLICQRTGCVLLHYMEDFLVMGVSRNKVRHGGARGLPGAGWSSHIHQEHAGASDVSEVVGEGGGYRCWHGL